MIKKLFKILFFFLRLSVYISIPCGIWLILFICSVPHIDNVTTLLRKPYITIYDKDQKMLAQYGDIYGNVVHICNLPKHLVTSVLLTEDRRFYEHCGIDIIGIIRSIMINIKNHRVVQGGSTITQQLSKNFLQNAGLISVYDRTLSRKIKELIVALMIESRFSKDEILSMYLNRVYFGGGVYGVDGAAQFYFNKKASELSLYESVILVGLLKSPSSYAPHINYDRALIRARKILQNLVDEKYISIEEMEATLLLATPPLKKNHYALNRYFTDWIVSESKKHINIKQDIKIFTTLDRKIQKYAEQAVTDVLDQYGKEWNINNSSFVVLDKEGQVKAMVGNSNYNKYKFNIAAQGKRQMGSTFKYFVYMTAMNLGYDVEDMILNEKITLGDWTPKNSFDYEGEYVSLNFAFAKSINTCAVRLLKAIGIKPVYSILKKMNILNIPLQDINYTLSLGTYETTLLKMAGGLLPMLNEGKYIEPFAIYYIAADKKILYSHHDSYISIVKDTTIKKMKKLMRSVVEIGTGRSMKDVPLQIYAKTGTAQCSKDLACLCILEKNQIDIAPDGLVMTAWAGSESLDVTNHPGKHIPVHICKRFLELLNK